MLQADRGPSPHISVVIPVYNGSAFLKECLAAVYASDFAPFEVIVVDDRSTDASISIARRFPNVVIESPLNVGPAAARNLGAREARGDILFFLDADILVHPDTLSKIAAVLHADPALSAIFGSYGTGTIPTNFFSCYKNLVHHYTHQHSREEASTFCSGFGAIRREAFHRLGGFDEDCRFLEDIELGYRMHQKGLRVRLCKDIQMTHCKRYSLASLVRSDVLGRAIPWTSLMLETGIVRNDLNTKWNNVLSVPVALLLALSPFLPARSDLVPLLLACFVALNAGFLRLTYSEGGPLFALCSCFMCWFCYLYSAAGVALGLAAHWRGREKTAVNSHTDLSEL
jgi:GT2 family glycosyltransferase